MSLDRTQKQIGVCVPLFALRHDEDLGIGDTEALKQFIDWAASTNVNVVQILPINETSGDNSPYNAISSMALEPSTLTITPETIPGLSDKDFKKIAPAKLLKELRLGGVQYSEVKKMKTDLLHHAFTSLKQDPKLFEKSKAQDFQEFCKTEVNWLNNYALYRFLVEFYRGNNDWESWAREHQHPVQALEWLEQLPAVEKKKTEDAIEFYKFVQWIAFRQWEEVKQYGEKKNVYLMGDMPFGVGRCSADVWGERDYFNLRWSGGAPPEGNYAHDAFVAKWGQNWGIPLYYWWRLKEDNYSWWRQRIQGMKRFFHVFRIDHILGFYRIWAFPWLPKDNHIYVNLDERQTKERSGNVPQFLLAPDDVEGSLINKAQGEESLRIVLEEAGDALIIGEDLGSVPDYVRPSLKDLKIPGMKIPIFERHWGKEGGDEFINPEEYDADSYTAYSTHDLPTMFEWWEDRWESFLENLDEMKTREPDAPPSEAEKASWELYRMQRFLKLGDSELIRNYHPQIWQTMMERLLQSGSNYIFFMITDLFGLETRFNLPGSVGEANWSARLPFTCKELLEDKRLSAITEWFKGAIQENVYSSKSN